MRIAFGTHPALGHVLPLLPLALALRDAGHEVRVLGGASVRPVLEAAGLRHVPAGPPDLPVAFTRVPERAGLEGRRLAALVWGRVFGGVVAPEMADALLALADTWRPDLLVHDDSEQGTWLAADRLGVPHVALQVTAWRGAGVRLSDAPLNALRARLGLPPDPGLRTWHRHGFLATRPRALWNPADPPPSGAVPLRPVPMDEAGAGARPEPVPPRSPGRRRVAVTLGTIVPGRAAAIDAIVRGLAALDVDVVATVGPDADPAAVAPGRPGVTVVRYAPMAALLATCDALVFHGGSGTLMAALAAGVPLVALPQQADQPENAERLAAAGAGLALGGDRSPGAVAAATRAVLDDPRYAATARTLRDAIAAMPAPETLVGPLERLAAAGADGVLRPA